MMTGQPYPDDAFYSDLVQCMQQTDNRLYESVNSQWIGIKMYARQGGNSDQDPWYTCDSDIKPDRVSKF